ncbi:MAG: hypothetical protein ACR2L9_05175 [Solirubrobacteraceae bacterium]
MAPDLGDAPASGDQPADDADSVRSAFRLGWAIAELRGRFRPDLIDHPVPDPGPAIVRPDHELPLANERSAVEQRTEVIVAVKGLSGALGLDLPLDGGTRPDQLDSFLDALSAQPADRSAWTGLTDALYAWDRQIQYTLVIRPGQAAGYQLGRGLAETYWSLHPNVSDPNDARCWLFLLGQRRQATLTRYVARLVSFLDPLVLPAIRASLESWGEVATDEQWRTEPEARMQLYAQGLLWRDLIRGERRAEDLDPVTVSDLLQKFQLIRKLWSAFWPQLAFGLLGAAVLVAGVVGLVAGSENRSIATAFAVLGVLGVTITSAYARAKANAASVLATIRDAVERDRVGRAATLCPSRPKTERGSGVARSRR